MFILITMKFRHKTKRIFAAALAVWLSGIVVLFCCGNMPTKAAATESCPLAKKSRCAKTFVTENAGDFFGQTPPPFDCCAFPAKVFDKVRKLEKSPEILSAQPVRKIEIAAPTVFSVEKVFASPRFYQSHVRNRGSTHLQNCVFRI